MGQLWYGCVGVMWTKHCINKSFSFFTGALQTGLVLFQTRLCGIYFVSSVHALQMCPPGSEFEPSVQNTTEMHFCCCCCLCQCNEANSDNCFFPSFFYTGQLQFLQHQMQQQQMAMGTAAPQVGAPQQHTASQPRSKRKRSMPQPLPKSWKAPITLRTVSLTNTRTWMIYTVLFVCLAMETKPVSFPCLFLADIFVWNVCQRSLENQNCFWP